MSTDPSPAPTPEAPEAIATRVAHFWGARGPGLNDLVVRIAVVIREERAAADRRAAEERAKDVAELRKRAKSQHEQSEGLTYGIPWCGHTAAAHALEFAANAIEART